MNCGEYAVGYVGFEVLGSERYDNFVAGKEADNRMRNKLEGDGKNCADSNGNGGACVKGVAGPVVVTRSDILSRNCADTGKHAGRNEEEEADYFFYNADSGCNIYTAAVCNNRNHNKGNLNKAVLAGNRHSDF